jgi:hypothetical protein
MKRWWSWVGVLSLGLATAPVFAKGKVDPKTVPGTVKWLCDTYENAFILARLSHCGAKEKAVEPAKSFAKAAGNNYHQCLEVVNSGLGQKRLAFSGAAAKKCASAQKAYLKTPDRGLRQTMLDACAGAVKGLKSKNDACESPLDCGPGLRCDGVKGASPGKCVKALGDGDACDTDLLGASSLVGLLQESHPVCGPGLVCSETSGKPRTCVEAFKTAPPQFRQAAGSACKDSGQCKGLCQSGTCKAVCGSG